MDEEDGGNDSSDERRRLDVAAGKAISSLELPPSLNGLVLLRNFEEEEEEEDICSEGVSGVLRGVLDVADVAAAEDVGSNGLGIGLC